MREACLVGLTLVIGCTALAEEPADAPADPRPRGAQVVVEKAGPDAVNVGEPLEYEIIVRNVGGAPAEAVRVEDELPAGTQLLTADPAPARDGERLVWTLGVLPARAERRLRVRVQPAGETTLTSRAVVTFATSATLTTRITRPQLAVTAGGPPRAVLGEQIVFRLEVANPGTGPATGVVVQVNLPAGLRHSAGSALEADLGTLPAGERRAVELTVTAAGGGRQELTVTALGDGGLRAVGSAGVEVHQPVLKLTQDGPPVGYLNTEAVFTLAVTNAGDAPARRVQLFDLLPPNLSFVAASHGGQYDPESHSVRWFADALPPGERWQVGVKVLAVAEGDVTNRAAVRAEAGVSAQAEAAIRVAGVPAVLLEVTDRQDPIAVGEETVYDVRVLNQGTSPATNLHVLAVAAEGLTVLVASGETPYRVQGRQVIFAPLPVLAPQAVQAWRVRVRGDMPGDHRFRVQLSSDQLRIPVCEEESTRVYRD